MWGTRANVPIKHLHRSIRRFHEIVHGVDIPGLWKSMNETARQALELLRGVKSVAMSTVSDGFPAVRIVDVMMVDEEGLYFVTARGKPLYRQLVNEGRAAVCGMDERYVTARVIGGIEKCGNRKLLDKIFDLNPILRSLYPGEKREILEVFRIGSGKGEIFDLSSHPPARRRFSFGGESVRPAGYLITEDCTACGACMDVCPVSVIVEGEPYVINAENCLECGACGEICPAGAVRESEGF